jgi:DNA-binding CsgD family transcriptional regulator
MSGASEANANVNVKKDVLAGTMTYDVKNVTMRVKADSFGLTKREAEVLPLLLLGYSPAYIAKDLFLSESTVKTHLHNIVKKIGVKSKAELIELFNNAEG